MKPKPNLRVTTTPFFSAIILFLAYFIGAWVGQFITGHGSYSASVWPPSGILLAFFLLTDKKKWVFLAFAGLAANLLFDYLNNRHQVLSLFFSAGNILEAVAGAFIIKYFNKEEFRLNTLKQLWLLITVSVFSCMISASVGSFSANLLYGIETKWTVWWSGDLAGIMMFAPLIIALSNERKREINEYTLPRLYEFGGLLILLAFVLIFVFLRNLDHYPSIEFLIFLPLLWSAMRFGINATTLISAIVGCFAIWATGNGVGPFADEIKNLPSNIFAFQAFIGGAVFIILIIAIIIKEKGTTIGLLHNSERRLQDAQIVGRLGDWELDPKTGIVIFSDETKKLLGPAYLGKSTKLSEAFNLMSTEDRQIIEKNITISIEKDFQWEHDLKILLPDEKELWFYVKGTSVRDAKGNMLKLYGVIQDITDRKTVEEKLKESETHFRNLSDSGQALIWTSDINKMCNYFNQPWLNFTGRKLEQELGEGWAEGVHPDDLQGCINTYVTAFDKREKFTMEYRVRNADGNYRWILDSGSPRFNSKGEFIGYIGHCLDISEQKKAKEELVKRQEFIEAVFENAPIGFAVNRISDGKAVFLSKKFEEIYGADLSNLTGVDDFFERIYIDPVYREEIKTRIISDMMTGDPSKMIWDNIRIALRNGDEKIVYAINIPLLDQDLMISTVQDVTFRKKAEAEVEKYRYHLEELIEERTEEIELINKELVVEIERKKATEILLQESLEKEKELNQLKSRFISTASHEFRTPLAAILSSVELIQRYGDKWDEEKKNQYNERIKNSVWYLTGLMDDILNVSRADAGKIVFDPVPTNLYELCNRIIEEFHVNLHSKQKLVLNYQADGEKFVLDSKQIYTILANLVSNACKYSPDGGLIELNVTSDKDKLFIRVRDEGIGIPENDIPILCEPFHRATNTNEIRGTGLGLTIVKNAIELHGGKIHIESTLGKGTTITVEIPIV